MPRNINQTMGNREWLLLITLSLLWGGSFFFVGVAVKALPPLTIVTLRVALAALTLWIVVWYCGVKIAIGWEQWGALLVMGFINNVVPFTLIVWGQTQIASGLASILNATTPIFTVIVAGWLLTDERFSLNRLFGVLLGFLGVGVMMGPALLIDSDSSLIAQAAILGGAVSYSFAAVYGRRFMRMQMAPIMTATGQVTASSLILAPIVLLVDRPYELPMPGLGVLLSVGALAILSTAMAYILYFKILASAGATNLLLVTLLIPISAVLLGVTILGETLQPAHFMGMFLIASGLLLIDARVLKRKSVG